MDNSGRFIQWTWLIILLVTLSIGVIACGGSGSTETENGGRTAMEVAVPTMPSARFTAVANQSVLTATVAITATTADVSTAASADLDRGARSYAKNNCAACHGEAGEGVADKGGAIAGTALTMQEFDTFLRTGGGLGAEHIFGPSAVSPTGMEYLHAYVQSLGQ